MAIFVDLDEEDEPTSPESHLNHNGFHELPPVTATGPKSRARTQDGDNGSSSALDSSLPTTSTSTSSQQPPPTTPTIPFRNGMTEALGCYPIAMAVASLLDLNALDNVSRTCRGVRQGLLQYRSSLVTHTLHCVNEDVVVDPEDTFRYRARAGNWFYMQEMGGDRYNGKSGSCARDMVAECRRCAKVVCRNCAIKPPAPIVLRDRHRRLCIPCTKAPLGTLAKPPLLPETPLDADLMKNAICTCQTEGVWLCHPCGRSIRGTDHDYQSIWRWRNQYGEVLGGLGTGIGDGDRGVICGRDWECVAAKEREQETDCDAEDARERSHCNTPPPWIATVTASATTVSSLPSSSSGAASTSAAALRPPSSASNSSSSGGGEGAGQQQQPPYSSSPLGPGYVRHEIEGIGGVVKTKRLTMVKVGACVPEWEDEKNRGEILGREVKGIARSWCGWCWRVIPGKQDIVKAAAARHCSSSSGTAPISGELAVR
ncbi:hypothetical protein PG994_006154 [Apiospora phragmitis]|uniref:F-box domain-containing protein n=1 Tax=Apiospora phragmitis TaxID=2905665 RepID=A0ABR1VE80_9PEZI